MKKKMMLIAACFAALLTFGACGEDGGHDHGPGSGHDHKSGSAHDGHGHGAHEHNFDKMDVLGKVTLAGLAITVKQDGHVDAGKEANIHVEIPAGADATVRVWFGKADAKPIGAPNKPFAHGNQLHASLIAPESLKDVLVWVEVESGEGDSKKTEKKSFDLHQH